MRDQIPAASVTAVNTQLPFVSRLEETLSHTGFNVSYLTGFRFDDCAKANPEGENLVDSSWMRNIIIHNII